MPYLACAATRLARLFGCAVVRDLTVANRVVAAAKAARPRPLVFSPVHGRQRLRLFVDASSVKNGVPVAHTGYAIFTTSAAVAPGPLSADANMTLLLYTSHRQRRVTHSSFSSEFYALLEGVRVVLELSAVHAHVHTGDKYDLPPIDAYTDNLSLFNTLDADGVVQPKEVGAAVQELREFYHGGKIATMTWLRARGQLADALTKAGRDTPLQATIRTGRFGVRLGASDFLSKSSAAAVRPPTGQMGIVPPEEAARDGRMCILWNRGADASLGCGGTGTRSGCKAHVGTCRHGRAGVTAPRQCQREPAPRARGGERVLGWPSRPVPANASAREATRPGETHRPPWGALWPLGRVNAREELACL
eukprot:TRINITY_DN1729_c0_g1_i2.p1 TRINITY_DN1729_c0_g1~~TRINITY_DN1729_c0_g1_i2.p1  ORF type:complete len:362 (-),score=33.23 TRINITY_DN1729_c0_g1_i2:107-1192(-)